MTTFASRFEFAHRLVLWLLPVAMTVVSPATANAQTVNEKLRKIENRWASAVYESKGREQEKALTKLLKEARDFAFSHDGNAEAAAWHGIIARECIRIRCNSRSGRLRNEARDALLKAESLDPFALGGRVSANLGALYAQTSSQFGGFGSDVKGIGYLWRALVIDPDCLDSNFLYAEFLIKEKKLAEARDILKKASATPARPDHSLADHGRHRQIRALLQTVESQIGQSG